MKKILIGLTGRALRKSVFVGTARVGKDEVAKILVDEGLQPRAFAYPLKRSAQILFGLTHDETWNDAFKEVILPDWGLSPRQIFQRMGTEGGRDVFHKDLWTRLFEANWDRVLRGETACTDESPLFRGAVFEAAVKMFELSETEALKSYTVKIPLDGWNWSMGDVLTKITHDTLPAVLKKDQQASYQEWMSIRSKRSHVKNNPTPYPVLDNPKGVVALDSRFENEASIIRALGGTMIHVERELPPDMTVVAGHASEKGVAIGDGDIVIKNDGTLQDLRLKVMDAIAEINLTQHNPSTQELSC